MAFFSTQARLFGLDLSGLAQAWGLAWQGLVGSPLWAWLRPHAACGLWTEPGQPPLRVRALHKPAQPHPAAAGLRHQAVRIPDDLLLRQTLPLPALPAAQLREALDLQVRNLSPFADGDLVWTHQRLGRQAQGQTVHVVITSRPLIEQYIQTHFPDLQPQQCEAWCLAQPGDDTAGHLVLPGFAEPARLKRNRMQAGLTVFLLVLALVLAAGSAVTPSVQLYLRALQARDAFEQVRTSAGPALAQREAYLRQTEQHRQLVALVGQPASTLRMLDLVTRALPDDTNLQTLELKGLTVQMTGYTPNTAALMRALGKVPGVQSLRAPAPATKPLGIPREVFNLELQIDPQALLAATP